MVDREELLSTVRRNGFDTLLSAYPDPVAVYDIEGAFLHGNEALQTHTGLTLDELAGLTFDDALRSDDRPLVLIELEEARAGNTRRFNTSGSDAGGRTFRADITVIPVREQATVVALIVLMHAAAKVEDGWKSGLVLEQRYSAALTTMSESMILVAKDWVVLFLNPSAVSLLGPNHRNLRGRVLWEALPVLNGSEFAIGARAAMTARDSLVVRDYYPDLHAWLEARFHPTAEGLAIYIRNVTQEQEQLDRAASIEAQVAAQAALLDIANDAIDVRDLNHVITYWNPAAERIFGWTADEVIGTIARDHIQHHLAEWDRATAQTIETGAWSGQLTQRARDGRELILDCRWTLVRDHDGMPRSILAVNTDITARVKQEQQLLRSQRMDSLGTLAGGIAHDLNNVLTPILLSTQLLLAGEKDAQRRELLTTIESGSLRGAEMLAQILTFGRGVEGQRAPVDIRKLITNVEKFCHDSLPRNVHLSVQLDPDLWKPTGDETQLFQVLVNLVINARDAMPSGGELQVRARNLPASAGLVGIAGSSSSSVVIEVEDSGTGMPPEVAAKVFEPFFTTKAVGEGTGLGLSTSSEIIRGHGGRLQVYSEEGVGSRFLVELPVADTAPDAAAPRTDEQLAAGAIPHGHGEAVLVVDDEAAIRTTMRRALDDNGYATVVASNGAEALEYLEAIGGAVDLVITDVTMPVIDGVTLILVMRERYPEIPIVAASGLAAHSRIALDPRKGPNGFLSKPYTTIDLLRAAASALGDSSSADEPDVSGETNG